MFNPNDKDKIDEILECYVEEISITKSKFDEAVNRYQSIGSWLERPESQVKKYNPDVFTQGSFRLGTVNKPIKADDDYDIDLVCSLAIDRSNISQNKLKEMIGKELQEYVKVNGILKPLKEGKRCWTLLYASTSQFHVDVLPAIPNADEVYIQKLTKQNVNETDARKGIYITDITSKTYTLINNDWPMSNPRGYSEWFRRRMIIAFKKAAKNLIDKGLYASVEDVPTYSVKTPLQKVIQLLKRHRDLRFINDLDNKPISIIISTISAQAYDGSESLSTALEKIIECLDKEPYITWNGIEYIVPNPVRPEENFANKWKSNDKLRKNYFEWVNQLRLDFKSAFHDCIIENSISKLGKFLGSEVQRNVEKNFNANTSKIKFPNIQISKESSGPWAIQ